PPAVPTSRRGDAGGGAPGWERWLRGPGRGGELDRCSHLFRRVSRSSTPSTRSPTSLTPVPPATSLPTPRTSIGDRPLSPVGGEDGSESGNCGLADEATFRR